MSTYLIGIFVTDFECKTEKSAAGLASSMEVRACSRPNVLQKLDHSLKSTVLILEFFQKTFEIPFQLPKLGNPSTLISFSIKYSSSLRVFQDSIAVGYDKCGMENFGAIRYG
jgi:aminopeptidase N